MSLFQQKTCAMGIETNIIPIKGPRGALDTKIRTFMYHANSAPTSSRCVCVEKAEPTL